ncbi:MAG: o-succinylbenzoate synthase [Pirellulales bacterium]
MRIDAIEIHHVRMPLVSPWRTAYGEDAAIESVLVRMESEGRSAWGETSSLAASCYSPEWAAGVFLLLRDWLAPAVLGREINSGDELQTALAHFKGNPFAKGALDSAWWVLDAARRGQPLHRLLGATRSAVDVGADFGVGDSIDELLRNIAGAVEQGFKRIKLKFRPGWDIPMLKAVRREFPSQTIHIDCNAAYALSDVELFRRVDEFRLAMIEQPLAYDDLVDHAKLQRLIETPICLDESIASPAKARKAIELGSCRYINLKPGRVGGITPALAVPRLCSEAGIGCWVGGMLESAVGARSCIALAMLDPFSYPADIFPSSRFYQQDLGEPAIELARGPDGCPQAVAADDPAIVAEPRQDLLKAWCVDRASLRAPAGR